MPKVTLALYMATSGEAGQQPTGRHIDQIKNPIEQIKKNPDSRRLIVSAWNVGEIEKMKLPPCHMFFQFYICGTESFPVFHTSVALMYSMHRILHHTHC